MSREIKFRAWGHRLLSDEFEMSRPFDFKRYVTYNESAQERLYPFVGEETVFMQFTGLKDRHGVEIYEGDIIKYVTQYYGKRQERQKVVEWIDDMQDDSFGEPLSMGYRFHGSEIEVIGNIYENGELLNAK